MWIPIDLHRLAQEGAAAIHAAFGEYQRDFHAITRRAKTRFESLDWHGMQRDAVERLEIYGRVIGQIAAEIRELLDGSIKDRKLWAVIKGRYSSLVAEQTDFELAETFFNSVTRRIFTTVGVDPAIEFLFSDFDAPISGGAPPYQTYWLSGQLCEEFADILQTAEFSLPFEDLNRDAARIARAIEEECRANGLLRPIEAIDVVRSVFYRNQGAYLVGRMRSCQAEWMMPLALAVHNHDRRLAVDAALLTADEVSVLFSFTRSYFHVAVDRPHELVAFLRSIMPKKPIAELYIAIGFNKHGKTELFRDLIRHINQSTDLFQVARGERGMVMSVFTLPSFDIVFKVIRDTFAYPKTTTRRQVVDRYELVYKHDRAGRLADVQQFEHLAFGRSRFSDELLAELAREAPSTVIIGEHTVEIKHVYTERRMTPLNLYLREVDAAKARGAVLDYGQAVKDLAATNIFPGDMLLKNFGVTRHGRVVFYDYDELCLVTDCNFREIPPPRDYDDEIASEPYFHVGPSDVFPEEFLAFMGLAGELRETFLKFHGDLLTARYWRDIQARHRAGELIDIVPYRSSRRLDD
jgi:isocitrate dehydrogenase kinase/phosphatase